MRIQDLNLKDSVVLKEGEYRLWDTKEVHPLTHLRNPHQTGTLILKSIHQLIKEHSADPELKKNGLMPVLKKIAAHKKYQSMSSMEFKALLIFYTGLEKEIELLFDDYFVQ